ncbi:carboxypeptidase regulatory-like domain-containing protein [Bizionia saleffrena]|uniref:Carboxypeptidase regulatory-like domain-containing protein n=1 Tax=Bizionia saleffrena TaxID=291189 RepID=A0A8H2LDV7_9FLAO|nr:carboxypeptidase-like regulatory domain-containing protein [Bizionia saleffrena]TYB76756.1 carboxypeptidase regulatory-like domain-containing protein [Bizionia saleffrena]
MKLFLLSCLSVFLFFSCSEEDELQPEPHQINISGKLLAPNNLDPISNAKVEAYTNATLKGNTVTNNKGEFNISLPEGAYKLVLSKGLFSTEHEIAVTTDTTLDSYKLDILPKIGVVTGNYDNIENVLYDIGLVNPITGAPLFDIIEGVNTNRVPYQTTPKHGNHSLSQNKNAAQNPQLNTNVSFDFSDLITDPALLGTYDILFLNCGLNDGFVSSDSNLLNYVNNGGFLYATDWASGYLNSITNAGADYLTFLDPERSGISLTTNATILNGDLNAWLLLNFGMTIDDNIEINAFLNSWQVVDSYDPNTCVSWLNGPVTYTTNSGVVTANKDLAFTFLVGSGAVFYASFHTENTDQGFSDVDRIMEYLVFEMSDVE